MPPFLRAYPVDLNRSTLTRPREIGASTLMTNGHLQGIVLRASS